MSSEGLLHVVRKLRTFSPTEYAIRHPFIIYWTLFGGIAVWANVSQYRRVQSMYPDYDKVRSREGQLLARAKQQELSDVMRYNNMVSTMRNDLTRK